MRTLFGEWRPASLPSPLPGSRAAVSIVPRDGVSDVVVSQLHGAATVHGHVAREYLQRTDGLLGPGMEVCLFSTLNLTAPIHCSAPLSAAALSTLAANRLNSQRHFSWRDDDHEWLTSHWQLFLPSQFTADAWVVTVSQPR
jgi:hypothetical protein